MKIKEDQEDLISGRIEGNPLPDSGRIRVILDGNDSEGYLDECHASDFMHKMMNQFSQNLCTCQKNGGEK